MHRLTPRDYQIAMLLVAHGLSNKVVARQSRLSEGTVKLHLRKIMRNSVLKTDLKLC